VPDGGAASGKGLFPAALLPVGLLPKSVETTSNTAPLMPKSVPNVTRAAIEKDLIFMGVGLTFWVGALVEKFDSKSRRASKTDVSGSVIFFAARVRSGSHLSIRIDNCNCNNPFPAKLQPLKCLVGECF